MEIQTESDKKDEKQLKVKQKGKRLSSLQRLQRISYFEVSQVVTLRSDSFCKLDCTSIILVGLKAHEKSDFIQKISLRDVILEYP